MVRTVFSVAGLVTALVPDAVIDAFEAGFVDNPDECERRPMGSALIRIEGIVLLGASLIGGRPLAWMLNITGVAGAILLTVPDAYRQFATTLLYERPEAVAWNDRYRTVIRVIGALYLIVALRAWNRRRTQRS